MTLENHIFHPSNGPCVALTNLVMYFPNFQCLFCLIQTQRTHSGRTLAFRVLLSLDPWVVSTRCWCFPCVGIDTHSSPLFCPPPAVSLSLKSLSIPTPEGHFSHVGTWNHVSTKQYSLVYSFLGWFRCQMLARVPLLNCPHLFIHKDAGGVLKLLFFFLSPGRLFHIHESSSKSTTTFGRS